MAVRRDSRGMWRYRKVVRLVDGSKVRISGTPSRNTKVAAEQAERARIDRVLAPGGPRKEAPRFQAFAKDFLDIYAVTNNKPSEVATKRTVVANHLVPAFGRLPLDRIGLKEIEAYKAEKLKPPAAGKSDEKVRALSPKTVNNHLTVLRRMLAVAVEWGHLEHVPSFQWLKVADPEFDFLDFAEAERLVAAADAGWRAMIVVGLKAGLRLGELLGLRWDDVDLVTGRLVVRRAVARGIIGTPKNGRSREIPLSAEALRALKAHRHLRGELVLCDEAGQLLTKEACKWPLWRACRRSGLRRIGWHVLRHTFASHLVMRCAPLKAVQELLGHATIEMTMRYSHLSPDVRRDVVGLLDQRGNAVATGDPVVATAAKS